MGEWLSLWGKRKDEIERRDWRRNKQEAWLQAQKVGEMERRGKREKCREKVKLEWGRQRRRGSE